MTEAEIPYLDAGQAAESAPKTSFASWAPAVPTPRTWGMLFVFPIGLSELVYLTWAAWLTPHRLQMGVAYAGRTASIPFAWGFARALIAG